MNTPVKVLIVEDSEDDAKLALRALRRGGFDPAHRRVQTAADLETALAQERWDAVISDFNMPGFTGMDALRIFRSADLDIPFILISGTIGEETAVSAMKAGASDYVMKKSLARLAPALERELKETQVRAAHRQAQEALADSEERFLEMAENIRDVFFLQDAGGNRMLYISPAYEEIWGRSCESLYANPESWTEAIHPDDRASTYEAYKQGMAAGSFELEFRIVRPDGPIRWIEVRGFPVRDDAGKIARIAGVAKDITERKQAEDVLRESKKLLQLVVENAPSRIFWKDRDLRYLGCNTAFAKDAGHSGPDELTGKTDFEMGWKDQAELYRGDDKAVLETGASKLDIEEPQTAPDGNTIWLRTSKVPLRDKDDQIIGILGLYQDITERKQAEQDLRESERRFSDLLGNVELISMMLDRQARITYCNEYLLRLTGWRLEEVIGKNWFDFFVPPEISDLKGDFFAALIANLSEARHHENEILTRSGERRLIRWNNSVLRSGAGDVIGTASIGEDITEQKRGEIRIKRLNRVYAVLSGINTLIVRTRDRQELFEEACRIAVEQGKFRLAWIGLLDANGVDVTPMARAGTDEGYLDSIQLTARDDALDRYEMLARALREKTVMVCNDIDTDPRMGRWREEALGRGYRSVVVFSLQFADKVLGVLLLYASEKDFFDTEEMKLLTELAGDVSFAIDHIDKQERLDYLAYYDVLTGLANRRLFLERVAQYMRSAASGGHKLALFLIDLQRFKSINDSLGRPAGDALLRQVAEWLTRTARDANLLARVGADHFALVVPKVKQGGDVARLLEKWMKAFLEHPFHLNDAVYRIAAKIGVALFPDDGADADALFRNAEAALKKAKARGERYLFYTQRMTEAVAGRLTLENQLRQALDDGEFVLHYQPKVNLVSGTITSAEALIRWNDPRTGLVPPGRFIPVLEEIGLIHEVGRWALRQAIADYLRWHATGLAAVRIAVNVSPLQLRNRGFIAQIEQIIGIDAQAPAGLELEITENLIMEDVKGTIASLGAIRDLGVSIAIDDFGTGFSSLSYLAKLPVDTLKIDRSFVIEMTVAPEGLALVSTIINLAHALKLKVVAEGVETEEQSSLLRLLGCDEMQGFLFSKPVPSEIFESRYLSPLAAADG